MSVCFVITYRIIIIHTQQSQCIDPKQVVLCFKCNTKVFAVYIHPKTESKWKTDMEKLFHNFLWGRHVLHFAMQSVRVHLSTLQMYFCIQFVCYYSAFWYYIVKSQVRSIIWLTGFFTTTVMFPSGISISGTQFFASFWFQWTCMLLGLFLPEYVKRAQAWG